MSDDPKVKPHDSLFRRTFGDPEHAAGVLTSTLPGKLVEHLDLGTLRPVETSFIEADLQSVCSDLIFEVELAGRQAFVYVLIEHQRKVDPMMGFRLLRYLVALWERWRGQNEGATQLPAIVPLVVHQGRRKWSAPTSFHDLIALPPELLDLTSSYIPNFSYLVDDLADGSIDALFARPMTPLGRLAIVCLRLATSKRDPLDELEPRERFVAEVVATPHGKDAYATIVRYLLVATEVDPDRLGHFSTRLGPDAAEGYMTGAQKLEERGRQLGLQQGLEQGLEQGREQGLEQGLEQGRAKERRALLVRLATLRFGGLSAAQQDILESVSSDEAAKLAERILDATTFEDLFVD